MEQQERYRQKKEGKGEIETLSKVRRTEYKQTAAKWTQMNGQEMRGEKQEESIEKQEREGEKMKG